MKSAADWVGTMARWHGRTATTAVAVVAASSMLAYRFANLDAVPFINDEPAFLAAARAQLGAGHWVAFSPLVGKQGLHYGPTVLWFYGVVHVLFGADPARHVFAMLACMTAAHAALAYGLGKRFGALLGATALAFVASSPYEFVWSRLAWDQTVDVASALIAFGFCAYDRITTRVGVLLGLAVGFAVSSHLMVLPLAAITFLFLAIDALRRRRWAPIGAAGAAALLVNLPYLFYLRKHYEDASAASDLSWDLVKQYALEPARVASLTGIDYFFDHGWGDFVANAPRWRDSWLVSPSVPLVLSIAAASGLLAAARTRSPALRPHRRIARLAIVTWVAYAFFFGARRLGTPPHYQFATWWVIPVGVTAALASLRRWRWVQGLAIAAVWAFALGQMQFIGDWMGYIVRRGGTQDVHYGTPLGEQKLAMRALCADRHARILVDNDTRLFDGSLRYVESAEPACAGKTVLFCGSDNCSQAGDSARVHVAYARPASGFLFLESAK